MFNGEENIERYSSSAWAERGFCKRCGSSLLYRFEGNESIHPEHGYPSMTSGPSRSQARSTSTTSLRATTLRGVHPRLTGLKQFPRGSSTEAGSHVRSPNKRMQPNHQPVIKFACANLPPVWRAAQLRC